MPLAYQEHGEERLDGDAALAVDYLRRALDTAMDDARSAGVGSPALEQFTWRPRLSLAAAHAARQDHAAAIAELDTLIDAFPPAHKVEVGPDGAFAVSPEVAALQRRAVVYETAGRYAEAMADCAKIVALKPAFSFKAFVTLRQRAQRTFGVAGVVAAAFNARSAEVDAETHRLMQQRQAAFERGMAPTWGWAHVRRAACAWQLKDHPTVIAEADAALALGVQGGAPYSLRAGSHESLGNFDAALQDCTRAIEADATNPSHHCERARTRLMAHLTSQGEANQQGDVMIDLRITQADLDRVVQDLRRTLELMPSHAGAREWLERLGAATTVGASPVASAGSSA